MRLPNNNIGILIQFIIYHYCCLVKIFYLLTAREICFSTVNVDANKQSETKAFDR